MDRIDVPVLVVGGGPVGLMAGILLERQGQRAWVIERREGPQTAPAAHVVNARSFEIARQAGLDMEAIGAACQAPEDAGQVLFVTRLNGEEVGRLPFERQGTDCLQDTPTPLRNLSQHRFEPILARALEDLPGVELRYGLEWESARQDDEGVGSVVLERASGRRFEVRSRILLAADGAGSRVRKSLGIAMEGPPRLQSFLMIHFEADLRRLVAGRPGVLHWILDPEAGGTFVSHDLAREWVYMHVFDPDREAESDYDEARCRALVERALGEAVPLRIVHRATWTLSAQVAERLREGRIFLVGDAAHRFPPTGGLGLNSGIQEVHNLVWKLAAVDAGWAGPGLLDSYEAERLPVARSYAAQSRLNAGRLLQIPQALGIFEEPTTARMRATLSDPQGRKAVEQAIANQAEHFDMLGMQLGFSYEQGAVVPDGSPRPDPADPVREYRASSRPGARLPHAWVRREGRRISTLDLVGDRGFTLFTQGDHDRWTRALAGLDRAPIAQQRVGEDFVDAEGHWARVAQLGDDGALLVRPDQHVAWRSRTRPGDPATALAGASATLLA